MPVSLKQIRYFIAAAESGQISQAAVDPQRLPVRRHRARCSSWRPRSARACSSATRAAWR